MMNVASVVILVLLLPLVVCWGLWLVFAVLALLPAAKLRGVGGDRAGGVLIDVLIPAHNEMVLLPGLLESLAGQTDSGRGRLGRVVVIADHCSDGTAGIGRGFGVAVLERSSGPRGKPGVLRDGLILLGTLTDGEGERAVAIVDADCTVTSNFVEELGRAFDAGYKVAQVADVVDQPNAKYSLSTIAFSLKNLIRPRGMARVGIPTQLFGTGMCFHGSLLAAGGPIRFSDHLTEDLAVSHDLLLRGIPPVFLPRAVVRSPIPEDNKSVSTQKIRWETGQVHTWKKLPGLMGRLVLKGQLRSALALLDWSAPPVAMAVLAWGAVAGLAGTFVAMGMMRWEMLLVVAGVMGVLACYVVLGTLQLAGVGGVVHLGLSVPRFFCWKLGLYFRMASGRGAKGWEKSRAAPTEVRP